MKQKQYKFQCLATLHATEDGQPCPKLGPAPCRMVLRGWNAETGSSRLFPVLVSCENDGPSWSDSPELMITVRLSDEDVPDYLGIGSRFGLWLGGDIGEGVITRRLYT